MTEARLQARPSYRIGPRLWWCRAASGLWLCRAAPRLRRYRPTTMAYPVANMTPLYPPYSGCHIPVVREPHPWVQPMNRYAGPSMWAYNALVVAVESARTMTGVSTYAPCPPYLLDPILEPMIPLHVSPGYSSQRRLDSLASVVHQSPMYQGLPSTPGLLRTLNMLLSTTLCRVSEGPWEPSMPLPISSAFREHQMLPWFSIILPMGTQCPCKYTFTHGSHEVCGAYRASILQACRVFSKVFP